jgi:uncharacterized RDD family membrane protein YckC
MPTCPSCHKDQVQSSAFCAYCGAVLDRPTTLTSPSSSTAPTPVEQPGTDRSATAPLPKSEPDAVRSARAASGSALRHETGDVGAYIVRRLAALAVDLVIVGGLIGVAAHAWVTNGSPGGVLTAAGVMQLLGLAGIALFAYLWLFEGLIGATLGKLLFGLGVGRASGGSAGLGRAFVRNLLLPVDLAVIGFLLAAVTPQRRRLGDYVAGTVVGNSKIGALAPLLGIIALGAATYAVYAYAGGIVEAQHLERDASRLAPEFMPGASPAPAATATPIPALTATPTPVVPTPQPSASAV